MGVDGGALAVYADSATPAADGVVTLTNERRGRGEGEGLLTLTL